MRFPALPCIALCAAAIIQPAHAAPGEREMMMATCSRVGSEASLCRQVVNDQRVTMNDKRSCLEAITLILQGSAWSRVRSLPPTLTCKAGLARVGYPVAEFLARWSRASAQR